jgi:hypothetical protein
VAEGALPVACGLVSFDDVSRGEHRRLAGELLGAMTGSEELPDGYALRFPAKPFLFLRIARWIELERACCPFLTIRLEIERSTPAYRVELTGPEGTKGVLQAELLRVPIATRG